MLYIRSIKIFMDKPRACENGLLKSILQNAPHIKVLLVNKLRLGESITIYEQLFVIQKEMLVDVGLRHFTLYEYSSSLHIHSIDSKAISLSPRLP